MGERRELITLVVHFEGRNESLWIEYGTKWLNLEAMLNCYLNVGDIGITYMDDENDEICLNSEEELTEAKKVARKQKDQLNLKVTRSTPGTTPPLPAGKISSSRAEPVEASEPEPPEPEPQAPKMSTNPKLPVQCSSSRHNSRASNSYYTNLLTAVGQQQAAKKAQQQLPSTETPAMKASPSKMSLADDMTSEANSTETAVGSASSETVVPEELVERVVRGVLQGLDRAVVDAKSEKITPRISDQSDSGRQARKVFCHLGIACDNCDKTIVGIRYKCGHCIDYDLCETCEDLESIHNPNHVFLKLRQPATKGLNLKSDGRLVPLLKRPFYNDEGSATVINSVKLKKMQDKMARRAAKVELKRKLKEEKRRSESRHAMSPAKRERLERMAERQVTEILQAAHVIGNPEMEGLTAKEPEIDSGESHETNKPLMCFKMDAEFVRDGNLPDDTHMQPGAGFTKSWVMKNSGPADWNKDTKVKFLWGNMSATNPDAVAVPPTAPGDEGVICLDFVAPPAPGQYQSHWRLAQDGEHFGHRIWCRITVEEPTEDDKKIVEDASQEASSNAVAQLQADQQDPSIPMRVCSSAEMLTAHDVLSFEMLKISDRNQPESEVEAEVVRITHQTTPTPHNTPLGVTPSISPVRELDANVLSKHMSQHSEMEIMEVSSEEGDEGIEEVPSRDTEDLETDAQIQHYLETLDGDGSSDDLLDDFEVVPLPDCFNPNKPLDMSILERKSSVTGTQTFLTLMEPLPAVAMKQDACVLAVTTCSTVATDVPMLYSTSHSECQTLSSEQRDVGSSASPSSMTVATDVDALCPTSHGEVQTDYVGRDMLVDDSFVHVVSSELQTSDSRRPSQRDASVAAVASSKSVATSAGSFLNIASSVTQTESCTSQDATTATAVPVSIAVSTSVDTLFNMLHAEAQTVTCVKRDNATHAVPVSVTRGTGVDDLHATTHSFAQTTVNPTQNATTLTFVQSSTMSPLAYTSPIYSPTAPILQRDATTTAQSPSVATDIDVLFNTTGSDIHIEPLIPSQADSPLQIINFTLPPVTVDTEMTGATDQTDGGIVISPFTEALPQPPMIIDVTNQVGAVAVSSAIGERDQEVFHDAIESSAGQEPSGEVRNETSNDSIDQDPMEALGFNAQKAMAYAGGFVKQAFDQAAQSVNALLNPQPLPNTPEWSPVNSQSTDPVDKLVEMGFGNRQRNKELLKQHKGNISRCVQELLQEQDSTWHAARH